MLTVSIICEFHIKIVKEMTITFCKTGGVGATWIAHSCRGGCAHSPGSHWRVTSRSMPGPPLLGVTLWWEVRLKLNQASKLTTSCQVLVIKEKTSGLQGTGLGGCLFRHGSREGFSEDPRGVGGRMSTGAVGGVLHTSVSHLGLTIVHKFSPKGCHVG